jgi:arylsulfatase A-like enzyme
MNRFLVADRYAIGVFFVCLTIEHFRLTSGATFPLFRVFFSTLIYAFPLVVAGLVAASIVSDKQVLKIPVRLLPFPAALAVLAAFCAWASRDLTSADDTMLWGLPFVSVIGWVAAVSVFLRLPARLQRPVPWLTTVGLLTAAGAYVAHGWLPDLNSMLKWWLVIWATSVMATISAAKFRQPRSQPLSWLPSLAVVLAFGFFQNIPVRFGDSPPRSAVGWAMTAISVADDRDQDGFFAEKAGGTDCDDNDPIENPASIRKPCDEALKPKVATRTKGRNSDHVFIFIVDAMRADVLENHADLIPNISALANESVVFENAYSPGNATLMSLPSMLTGVTPVAMQDAMVRPDLKIQHYQEGRWIFDLDERACTGMVVQAHSYADWLFKAYPKPEATLFFTDETPTGHGAPNAVPRFKDALDKCGDRRKTFVVYMDDPHIENDMTYACKDGSRGGFECYLEEISVVDEAIGQMITELRSRPKMDRTTIIITSDHGEAFGEHHHVAHASSVFEEQVHVPLVINQPWRKPQRVTVPVTTLGLAATVADETYANRPDQYYPSLLQAADTGVYPAPIAYNWIGLAKLAWTAPSAALRVGEQKVVLDFVTNRAVMYDLKNDPDERVALPAPPELVKQLRQTHGTLVLESRRKEP